MSVWNTATLRQNDGAGPGLHRLSLEVPAAVSSGLHAPGQYHRVRVPSGDEATFAIASAPGTPHFEYLIRENDGAAGELTGLSPGATVEVSMPQGPGFPVERGHQHDVLLIGTGTGFAPLRAVVLTILKQRAKYREVHGAYGALTPAHLAFGGELEGWKREGVVITPTVTTPHAQWTGAVGQVQALLASLPAQNAVAFLCGQNEMVGEVRNLLEQRGVPANRVFVNF